MALKIHFAGINGRALDAAITAGGQAKTVATRLART